MMLSFVFPHPGVVALAFFQSTQLSLFEQFLTRAVSGINSTGITSGMQNVAYVVLLVGFLWQVYQSALHGGDVRGLGTNLIKYVVTAFVVMNYSSVFTTINQGFVNSGNWISNASGAGNLFDNWKNDISTQFSQAGTQQLWGLVTGSLAGLIDGLPIIVAYILYPVVITIFGFFYIFYGAVLYIFGPIVIALLPLGPANRIAKAYIENVFVWNSWPILYGGFGALLSAVQMGQVGQMLDQNSFLGGLGNLEGSFLIGIASVIYSLAIAVIPFIAKKVVSGDVGATAGALIGAAATALTAGVAAAEGAAVGAAAGAGGGGGAGVPGTTAGTSTGSGGAGKATAQATGGNQPAPSQRNVSSPLGSSRSSTTSDSGAGPGTSAASRSQTPFTSVAASPGASSALEQTTGQVHAAKIRDGMKAAMGQTQAQQIRDDLQRGIGHGTSPPKSTSGIGSDGSPVTSSARSNSSGGAGGPSGGSSARSSAPAAYRTGIATWGAYHAARLATKGAVSAGRAVGDAGANAISALTDPIDTANRIGSAAGRAVGTIANAAAISTRAVQSVADAASHPVSAAQRGVDAVASAVGEVVNQTSAAVHGSVDAARSGFADSYDRTRRENERTTQSDS